MEITRDTMTSYTDVSSLKSYRLLELSKEIAKDNFDVERLAQSLLDCAYIALDELTYPDADLLMALSKLALEKIHRSNNRLASLKTHSFMVAMELEFGKDPSNFFMVYFFAISLTVEGKYRRSRQLFNRLSRSGWRYKDYAKQAFELICEDTSLELV